MLQQWMITVGILLAYIVALVILKIWPNAADVDWRWFFGLGAIPAIVGLILRVEMPESPRWLIRKGRYDDAQEAFAKLDVEVTVEDVEYTAHQLEQADAKSRARQPPRAGRRACGARSGWCASSSCSSRSPASTCRCTTGRR